MRMQTLILNTALVSAVVVFVNLATTSRAAACSCVQPSVESSYHNASDVAFVDVRRTYASADTRYYVGYVARTFKGCLREWQRVILKTPVSSATCGAELSMRRYLINGTRTGSFLGTPVLAITLCSYDRRVSELTAQDLVFLNGRTVCCGDACRCADGTQPVPCLVDPCSVARACEEGECVANYCGGCHAEFYDPRGEPVCEGPMACKSDEDCLRTGCSGQVCAAQDVVTTCEYRPEYACYDAPGVTQCGCFAGQCGWEPTVELTQCIEDARSEAP